MKKLKVQAVMDAYTALANLSARDPATGKPAYKFPAKGAYRIARLLAKLKPEFQTVEEKRIAFVRELGKPADDGSGNVTISGAEAIAEFNARMSAILSEEIEIDVQPIPLELFGNVEISAGDLADLGELVCES